MSPAVPTVSPTPTPTPTSTTTDAGTRVGAGVHPAVVRRFVTVDDPRWVQAHGSTVWAGAGGDRVVAWFAGTAEGTADSSIWVARRAAGEQAWGPPALLLRGDVAHWNPVLATSPSGDLWLFAKRGSQISTWATWVRVSTDDGRTWGPARELVPGDTGGRGPVRNPPLVLADGTWLAPGSTEVWHPHPRWDAFVDRSVDGGATWTAVPVPLDHDGLRGAGVIQPALWSSGERVLALLRSSEGSAYRAVSEDGGRSWGAARPTALPNNNAALAVLGLGEGVVVCAHNPTSGDWASRCPLVLSLSHDDGLTWRRAAVLEDGLTPVPDRPDLHPCLPTPGSLTPADGGVLTTGVGEYSYPALIRVGDHLSLTSTWQRRGIVEATVPLSHLPLEEGPS